MAAKKKTIGQKRDARNAAMAAAPKVKKLGGDRIDTVIAEINKRLGGQGRVFRGTKIQQRSYLRRSSGIPSIDYITQGGYPKGGLVEFGGEYSTGKTSVCLEALAHLQKQRTGEAVAWVALEPFSKKWARERGFFIPFCEDLVPDQETGEMKPLDPFADASPLELRRMREQGIEDPYTEITPFVMVQEERGDVALDAALDLIKSNQFAYVVVDSLGVAKCLGVGTPVLRHDGIPLNVEDVQIGDSLMGPDGQRRHVLSTTRGAGPLYRVDPVKGDSWVCNDAHILTLVHSLTNEIRDMSVQEYLELPRWKADYWKQFLVGVDFRQPRTPLPVDPYFVGLWYGDGTKDLSSVSVTNMDHEVVDFLQAFAPLWGLGVTITEKAGSRAQRYTLSGGAASIEWTRNGPVGRNRLLKAMRLVYGEGGRLPERYLLSRREERLRFLAGLIDTDGTYGHGCFSITQKRRAWADDIAFLARSLGFRATLAPNHVSGGEYWRVCISGDIDQVPVLISRKRPLLRRQKKRAERTGISITRIDDGAFAGFTLDGDGRFLLGDFTVTHNSTSWLEEKEVQDASDFPREAKMIGDYTTRAVLSLNKTYDANNMPADDGERFNETTVLHINQITTAIGVQAYAKHKTQTIKGGEGNKHNHHAIIFLWKGTQLLAETPKGQPTYNYGQEVHCICLKSKLGIDMLEGQFDFYRQPYGALTTGDFDVVKDLVGLADMAGTIVRAGAWYELDETFKANGKPAFCEKLRNNPEWYAYLAETTRLALRRK